MQQDPLMNWSMTMARARKRVMKRVRRARVMKRASSEEFN